MAKTMLRSFSVENYRSFKNAARIELRPITLLLGENSSGKSSLTRFIPLVQQSIDKRTASPILWNSDVIDFGDIGSVLNHNQSHRSSVRLGFEVSAEHFYRHVVNTSPYLHSVPKERRLEGSFFYTASLTNKAGRTNFSSLEIEYEGVRVRLEFGERQITAAYLNEQRLPDYVPQSETFVDSTRLFPTILFRRQIIRDLQGSRPAPSYSYEAQTRYKGLDSVYNYFVNRKTSAQRVIYNKNRLWFVPKSQMAEYASTLENLVRSKIKDIHRLDQFSNALFVDAVPSIIAYCEARTRATIESASYLGPSRASGARFYRYQELSVDRIDARGENLPMYLSSLSQYQLDSFNLILSQACGYKVRVSRPSGHASIEIAHGDSNDYENLADVGFGFSQFLPIVAQIHAALYRTAPRTGSGISQPSVIAIEQPELHLHPAFQAGLGDLFANSLTHRPHSNAQPNFLIETHSEALIARLGELIATKRLSAGSVILYFVEKDEETRDSTVKVGGFEADGSIRNWPIGFFSSAL